MVMFEWDETKQIANLAKHGIDFWDLGPAFLDFAAKEMVDTRMEYGEERRIRIARCEGSILIIVYTLRGNNIRLISARRASAQERMLYER
jgi:uncharacterized protein